METEIIKAGPDDMPLLLEWRMRVLSEVFSIPTGANLSRLSDENRSYYEKHLCDGSHVACFIRVKESGEIIGCGGICYQEELPSPDNEHGSCGYLMNIYTLPEYRGMGVGRKLVEFLIQDARARGTGKIYLESSDAARRLYQELGFSELDGYMKL